MIVFEAEESGDKVVIPKNIFRYMVLCWDKQKDIQNLGGNLQDDIQKRMDEFYKQAKEFLYAK